VVFGPLVSVNHSIPLVLGAFCPRMAPILRLEAREVREAVGGGAVMQDLLAEVDAP